MEKLPDIIGITMGCPVGVGPEIILRFLAEGSGAENFRPVVLGDCGVLARAARELALKVDIIAWQPGEPVKEHAIAVFPLSELPVAQLTWGKPSLATDAAMGRYIKEGFRLQRAGVLAALVTCPITKKGLQAAGYDYPGHTEMLASLCGADEFAMMMAGDRLRVTLVTIHQRLGVVPAMVTREAVLRIIRLTGRALQTDFGIARPRLAVAGLNPHAGEQGLFGSEEEQSIRPAVAAAAAEGWQVSGPLPPDTVFHRAAAGHYEAVVAMYHDQGLIPFKLLHFRDGVNVTLGLPLVRTSVDHGTAYDIAGKGLADPASLRSAFRLAGRIAAHRHAARNFARGATSDGFSGS